MFSASYRKALRIVRKQLDSEIRTMKAELKTAQRNSATTESDESAKFFVAASQLQFKLLLKRQTAHLLHGAHHHVRGRTISDYVKIEERKGYDVKSSKYQVLTDVAQVEAALAIAMKDFVEPHAHPNLNIVAESARPSL